MSDQLLVVLRVCLLVLVYLVFLRVLRAVWVEMRAGASVRVSDRPVPDRTPVASGVGSTSRPAGSTRLLVMVEPPARAGTAFALDPETTIGRAAGCRISVDDTHVSKMHARVFTHDGRWFVEDLGSTNGTLLNGALIETAVPLSPGDRIRVGETVLELE